MLKFIKKRSKTDKQSDNPLSSNVSNVSSSVSSSSTTSNVPSSSSRQWRPLTENLALEAKSVTVGKQIGKGSSGVVFKGKWMEIDVAIKTLNDLSQDVQAEVDVLRQLRHPCVVLFFGVTQLDGVAGLAIVLEFCEGGSLDRLLRDRKRNPQPSADERIRWAKQISRGLGYLASQNIVHRDLAARNVLLDGSLNCKLTDFGLACDLDKLDVEGEKKMPIRWTAPETFASSVHSFASDVYSLGLTLWEVYGDGRAPFAEFEELDDMQKVAKAIMAGRRPTQPPSMPDNVFSIVHECWRANPDARPSAAEVAAKLGRLSLAVSSEADSSNLLTSFNEAPPTSSSATPGTTGGAERSTEQREAVATSASSVPKSPAGIDLRGPRNAAAKSILLPPPVPGNKPLVFKIATATGAAEKNDDFASRESYGALPIAGTKAYAALPSFDECGTRRPAAETSGVYGSLPAIDEFQSTRTSSAIKDSDGLRLSAPAEGTYGTLPSVGASMNSCISHETYGSLPSANKSYSKLRSVNDGACGALSVAPASDGIALARVPVRSAQAFSPVGETQGFMSADFLLPASTHGPNLDDQTELIPDRAAFQRPPSTAAIATNAAILNMYPSGSSTGVVVPRGTQTYNLLPTNSSTIFSRGVPSATTNSPPKLQASGYARIPPAQESVTPNCFP